MEPRQDELHKGPEPRTEGKKRRFQILKLDERIAPGTCRVCNYAPYLGGCYRVHVKGKCP